MNSIGQVNQVKEQGKMYLWPFMTHKNEDLLGVQELAKIVIILVIQ